MQSYSIPQFNILLDRSENDYVLTIHDLPNEDRPRDKLLRFGPEALSVEELMSVLINTGTIKEDVMSMSHRIVREYGEMSIFVEKRADELAKNLNIPITKACQIIACGELGRRFFDKNRSGFTVIRNAKDAYEYLQDMRNLNKEHLRGLYLNSRNRLIRDEVISMGTVSASIIHAREVFRPAIECNASAIILAHNHPSQDLNPSEDDILITKRLKEAGKMFQIPVLDHIIITKDSFKSLNEI
jgi:DNA repair protein RadC